MDLRTRYMGLDLSSPLVLSASPISRDIDHIRQAADSGAGAVVLWSLFEEQLSHDADELEHYLHYGADRFAESLTYFPTEQDFVAPPEAYLQHITAAKKAVAIPIIASLNGVSAKGWTGYARQMVEAGADAIELNVYYIPTDPDLEAAAIEAVYLNILAAVKAAVDVPVAVKLSPFFSSTANMLTRLDKAGANGLVLFNRFYQPDIDVDELEVVPNLRLSTSIDSRLPMRWTAIMYGKLKASIAITSGIHTAEDVVKAIMAGADVAQLCSALLLNGVSYLADLHEGLTSYMKAKGYESVREMKGILSQANCPEPSAFERANYMKALSSYGQTPTFE